MIAKADYNQDFHAWLVNTAGLLRAQRFDEIDAVQVADELEAMSKSEKRELLNRLTVLLAHLLKWRYQPARRSRSWHNTLSTQRIDILELLEDSPSLKPEIMGKIGIAYEKAALLAEDETGIDKRHFPDHCPFTLEQILSRGFLPEEDS